MNSPAYELQQLQINIEAYNSLKYETQFPQINQIPNETDFDLFKRIQTLKNKSSNKIKTNTKNIKATKLTQQIDKLSTDSKIDHKMFWKYVANKTAIAEDHPIPTGTYNIDQNGKQLVT